MANTTTATADTKDPRIDPAKAADKDAKVMTKADVRDRLLLELADRVIAHPEGLIDRVSALRDELGEDMGLSNIPAAGQLVQHPAARAEERQANIDLAVASAVKAGLVPEDHQPGDAPVLTDQHPKSDTPPVTVSIPAAVPTAELKPDRPMDPTAELKPDRPMDPTAKK